IGTPPALSLAMRSRSMSVQTTSCPASARQAPVTKPTYPQPMTERRKTSSPWDDLLRDSEPLHPKLPASHCRRIPQSSKVLHSLPSLVLGYATASNNISGNFVCRGARRSRKRFFRHGFLPDQASGLELDTAFCHAHQQAA